MSTIINLLNECWTSSSKEISLVRWLIVLDSIHKGGFCIVYTLFRTLKMSASLWIILEVTLPKEEKSARRQTPFVISILKLTHPIKSSYCICNNFGYPFIQPQRNKFIKFSDLQSCVPQLKLFLRIIAELCCHIWWELCTSFCKWLFLKKKKQITNSSVIPQLELIFDNCCNSPFDERCALLFVNDYSWKTISKFANSSVIKVQMWFNRNNL